MATGRRVLDRPWSEITATPRIESVCDPTFYNRIQVDSQQEGAINERGFLILIRYPYLSAYQADLRLEE
jgi:hypothetical protein